MRKFGPISIEEDYENEEEDISSFGPLTAKGDLRVRSVKTHGPLVIDGNIIANTISVNGPVKVSEDLTADEIKVNGPLKITGTLQISLGKVNGPLDAAHDVKVNDFLQVNGPFSANMVTVGSIKINGSVDVDGSIIATDEIVVGISSSAKGDPLRAQLLKAPRVEILVDKHGLSHFIGRIIGVMTSKRSRYRDLVDIDVSIEADEVILDGVRHTGTIISKNIILENGAEYIGNQSS